MQRASDIGLCPVPLHVPTTSKPVAAEENRTSPLCADGAPARSPALLGGEPEPGRDQAFQRHVPQAWCRAGCSDIGKGRRSLRLPLHPPSDTRAQRPSQRSCLLARAPGAGAWDAFALAAVSLLPSSTCCDPGHLSRHQVIRATSCTLSHRSHRWQVSYEPLSTNNNPLLLKL